MHKIETVDIRKWAKEYDGEKFHAILSDPPYALVSITKRFGNTSLEDDTYTSDKVRNGSDSYSRLIRTGFMGQAWDNEVAFDPELWYDISKHLYPGAYLLAFGGTRTFHRLACAIEDAGFEIRDTVMWLYGCLSEDTEILTINGWERYHKNIADNPVLCYNVDKDAFEFHKPTKFYNYANEYTAYHIKSDSTDQIVSRNHRCFVERGGRKVFAYAETLEREESVPFLESLQDLPETIYEFQSHTSIKKCDLLKRMSSRESQTQADGTKKNDINPLRCLWKGKMDSEFLVEENKRPNLFQKMQRCFARSRLEKTRPQGQIKVETRKRTGAQGKNDRRKELGMEGWGNLFQDTWQLYRRKIRALSEGIFAYGSQRQLYYGAPSDNGEIHWKVSIENGMYSSHQPRCNGQPDREFNAIQDQSGTQKIRRTRATVTPIEYDGNVWCVEVPTGAFVARRNGKIFITGNSGFPKSHNVGKAIDKQAGVERKVVGIQKHPTSNDRTGDKSPYQAINSHLNGTFGITEPATDMAKIWDGYGSALKPAFEPVIVARKPLDGTIANNCIKYGSGALNIDGCRVGTEDDLSGGTYGGIFSASRNPDGSLCKAIGSGNKGRWPANIITDGSEEVLEGFPQSNGCQPHTINSRNDKYEGWGSITNKHGETIGYNGKGSAARFFYCAKVSPSERNAGCEDMEEVLTGMSNGAQSHGEGYDKGQDIGFNRVVAKHNNHPTLKPIALTEYLAKLILPPVEYAPRRILIPFAGSGSEMLGAFNAGWEEIVGIELSEEYTRIAEARLKYWTSLPRQMTLE